ncbi:penicillin-binding protein [Virgibacillus indicus]|uniref:Penicillin-binding protein n=1 Tax=Virgibacillus indicus TaxID=2024554 RepID=A0A265NDM4_9BACI|nr:penicillin-binding protein 1A [Virgibacillus indicus]OZU90142.1 penicillin-binding protein [Virgibacillus indicus]
MADNSQSRSARRKQKKSKKKPIWKKVILTLLIIFAVTAIGAGAVGTYWIVTAPDIEASKLSDPFSSILYDQNKEEFAVLGSEKRKKVEFDDLPQVLVDAVTATEDARFFEHSGIDIRRIGGAIIANIKNGFGSEGASTITQQVVEKAFLSHEKELKIKVQEQWLALKLEQDYSKEQILEMYLNKIFYGNNAYGVAQAAENYFGKSDLDDLTLPEAAILAGLPQRPTAYNPFENPDLTKQRMNTVLSLMVRHDKITEEQAEEARAVEVTSLLTETKKDSTPYEGFIQQVQKEVKKKVDGADIFTDGLKIYTTLDTNVQERVEFLLTDSEENPIPYPDDEMQAAMSVIDTKTGAIKGIGGRRNSKGNDEFNYAINGSTQAGSTAKPIVAYGPAIEYDKMSTYHQINDDKPYEINGNPIRNWNRKYSGWITARQALVQSLNVPTIKVLEETGTEKAKEFANGLGYEFADDTVTLGDAIGGTGTEVTPLQLAGSYSAFGNEGIYNEPYSVTKVEFPDGRTVELKPEPEAAMSDYTAYMITDMLKDVVTEGSASAANVPGLPIAGKTGTTNLDDGGVPDYWFVGYTTNYTISSWVGGYQNEDGGRGSIPESGRTVPQELFSNTLSEISKDKETADFNKPDSVVEAKVEKGSNPAAKPSEHTPSSQIVTELFVKGTEPTSTSEKYDELDPVTDLSAEYNEDSNSIEATWNYDSDEDITFDVSMSVDGGSMEELSSTDELSIEVSEVEPGGEYEIQVVANNGSMTSEPKTATVTVPDSDNEDEEENNEENEDEAEGNIPPVNGLSAQYDGARSIIDVSWNYNGPPAAFEVTVNGEQTQTVQSNGIEISNTAPGQSYTISVTPIGQNGNNQGVRGEAQSTEVTVPEEENNESENEGQGDGDQGSESTGDNENEDGQNE